MERENLIEQHLRRQALLLNVLVYKFTSPGRRGVPDDLCIWPDGHIDFCELKTVKGILSPLQRHHLDKLTKAGQSCYVLRGKLGVDLYLKGELKPWI